MGRFQIWFKTKQEKCELITTHPNSDIHFKDKNKVLKVKTATYLGMQPWYKKH